MNTQSYLPISNVRTHLPELVNKVDKYFDRVVITVNGKPKAALVSAQELESFEETAKVMAIPNIKEDIKKSKLQIKKNEYIPLADLK